MLSFFREKPKYVKLLGFKRHMPWTLYEFQVDGYSYDFMRKAAQTVIDYALRVDTITISPIIGAPETEHIKELKAANLIMADCLCFDEEVGVMGVGVVTDAPCLTKTAVVKIVWMNQLSVIRLFVLGKTRKHQFDLFLDRIVEEARQAL